MTSGGAGGAGTPGSTTNVTFDSNSGTSATVTVDVAAKAASVTINKSDLTLKDNTGLTVSGAMTLTTGILNTNAQTETWGSLSSSNANARTLTLTNSIINLTGTGTAWNLATITSLTRTLTGSTINLLGSGVTFAGGGIATYGKVAFSGGGSMIVSGINTYVTLSIIGTVAFADNIRFQNTPQTVSGTVTLAGNSQTARLLVKNSAVGANTTISAAVASITNTDFQNITGSGAAAWSGTSFGDCGGNSGLTPTGAVTRFWIGNTGNYSNIANWSATTGGSGNATMPLCQDTTTFDGNSFSGAGQTVTWDEPRYGIITFATATNAPAISVPLAVTTMYGNVTLTTGMVVTGTAGVSSLVWILNTGATLTSGGAQFNNVNIIVANKAAVALTLGDDFSYVSMPTGGSVQINSGTFTANNHNLTAPFFASIGSLTRVINMGSGTWRCGADSGNCVNMTSTGMTLNPSTSTVEMLTFAFPPGGVIFAGAGLTYNNFNWADTTASLAFNGFITFTGANTFNDFLIAAIVSGTGSKTITFPASTTTTATTMELNANATYPLTVKSSSAGTQATISVGLGTVNASNLIMQDIAATGGAVFTCTSCTNAGNNSGWIFNYLLNRDLAPSSSDNAPMYLAVVG